MTTIDQVKQVVDFKVISIIGKYVSISWNRGGNQTISKRELKKLQKQHTWTTDF
jgi:hypothetical protein